MYLLIDIKSSAMVCITECMLLYVCFINALRTSYSNYTAKAENEVKGDASLTRELKELITLEIHIGCGLTQPVIDALSFISQGKARSELAKNIQQHIVRQL